MKYFNSLILCLVSLLSYGQGSICDSVFVAPDTIYLNQESDLSITMEFTYTGDQDLSYAYLKFRFPEDSPLNITDSFVTHGISGPYVFKSSYNLIYLMSEISPFTEVLANYNVWQGNIDLQFIGCDMPVLFVINGTTSSQFQNQEGNQIRIVPNPMDQASTLDWNGMPDEIFKLTLFNSSGNIVFEQQEIRENKYILSREQLPSGIYYLVISLKNGKVFQSEKILLK